MIFCLSLCYNYFSDEISIIKWSTPMINAVVSGLYSEDIIPFVKNCGIRIVDSKTPDVVITYGGDGTLLAAEREFPGIPKFPIRDTRTAHLCCIHSVEDLIKSYVGNKLEKSEMIKISAKYRGKELIALNDIFVHNCQRVTAIRYSISIDDEVYIKEAASDSFGIATPHGSTAYFKSITGTVFRVGIGLAFSNSREHEDHVVIPETSTINVKILRGPAMMVADNSPEIVDLDTGDFMSISKSENTTMAYGLKEFMCLDCRKLRHKRV